MFNCFQLFFLFPSGARKQEAEPAAFLTHIFFSGVAKTIRGVHLHASKMKLDVMKSNYDKMRTCAMKCCGKS